MIGRIYRVGQRHMIKRKRLSSENETMKLNSVKIFGMYEQILFRMYHPH